MQPQRLFLLVPILFAGSALAQSNPVLVKDINQTATALVKNPHSYPQNLTTIIATTYFSALSQPTGYELYSTLGISGTTKRVKDINPGPSNSRPSGFFPYKTSPTKTEVFFAATTANEGREFWKTDGTTAGTVLVKDMLPGGKSASPSGMDEMGGTLYILLGGSGGNITSVAGGTSSISQLWKSDGTTAGTTLVKDILATGGDAPAPVASSAGILTVGTTVFLVGVNSKGTELWKSDGTTAGTVLVKDIYPGVNPSSGLPNSSNPSKFIAYKTKLFFTANNSTNGTELWSSDGTSAGTVPVRDIRPGTVGSYPNYLLLYKTKLFFTANNGTNGAELWSSDGTAAGTAMLKDIRSGTSGSSPMYFADLGGILYFRANDGASGNELWKTDGTALGTVLAVDLRAGTASSSPQYLAAMGGNLYFSASIDKGYEIYKSNGTVAGTTLLKDINTTTATASSSPAFLTVSGLLNAVIFRANDGITGYELWTTNGTPAGTFQLMDINPASLAYTSASSPNYLTALGEKVVFAANDGVNGTELWISDGTGPGTKLLSDIRTGTSSSSPYYLTFFNGAVYFRANDGATGNELWKTDGTSAGTVMVKDIRAGSLASSPYGFYDGAVYKYAVMKDAFYFRANDGSGNELWKSDGTAAGTVMVKDIRPGTGSSSPNYGKVIGGDTMYFYANDGSGYELWKTDGTTAGTVRVKDINPGTASSSPQEFIEAGGKIYFRANGGSGYELWVTDGTGAGTVLVKDINTTSATAGGYPRYFVALGSTIYFSATNGTTGSLNGYELWKSDGTAAGTVMVKDINPGSTGTRANSSSPNYLRVRGGKIYFQATGPNGSELWASDGTTAGTVELKDINPWGDSRPTYLTHAGTRHLWFSATTTVFGQELYRTDGSAAGTKRVGDINVGDNNSSPYGITLAGGKLLFRANDGIKGNELWMVKLPGATATEIGVGCETTGLPPRLTSADPVLAGSITLGVSQAPASKPGMIFIGLPHQGGNLGFGCALYINMALPSFGFLFATSPSGTWALPPVAVPNDPALVGTVISVQAGVDSPGTLPLNVALTNGLYLVPGN